MYLSSDADPNLQGHHINYKYVIPPKRGMIELLETLRGGSM